MSFQIKPTNHQVGAFRMRGESMTRIETFVAAAFAFAVTMMIISVGAIPTNIDEFVKATKQIPSFIASCALIIWIWHTHANWSRRYGLEDGLSIFLSSLLIILVLVYIYPLRLIMQMLFHSISSGFFPVEISFNTYWEIRFMFAFYAIGFILLSINFIGLYVHALRKKLEITLSPAEQFDTQSEIVIWLSTAIVSLISLMLAIFIPPHLIGYSGYIFFVLFPLLIWLDFTRAKRRKRMISKLMTY